MAAVDEDSARARRQLAHLYTISKVLNRFESIERTVPELLQSVSTAIALRVVVLVVGEVSTRARARAVTWHAEDVDEAQLRSARERAASTYAYLTRADPGAGPAAEHLIEEDTPLTATPGLSATAAPRSGKNLEPLVLPLVVGRGPIFGALLVEGAAAFDEADLGFVNAFVNQLAVAMDRHATLEARQAAADRRRAAAEEDSAVHLEAEQRQRFLAQISEQFAASLDPRETLAAVVRATVPFLADLCIIDELAADGSATRVEVVFADPDKQSLADHIKAFCPASDWHTPQATVIRSGEPCLVPELHPETIPDHPAHDEVMKLVGARSMIVVPLRARGRTLGALTLVSAESERQYAPPDLSFAEEIGHRVALAVDNGNLYEQALRATKLRQDVLAIVSHDVKNLVAPISYCAAVLRASLSEERLGASARRALDTIERCSTRMNHLLGDLLDVASLEAGHLAVEKSWVATDKLAEEALETVREAAAQQAIHLEADLPAPGWELCCDRQRLLQVFANLLGNAIKFVPKGGAIRVRASTSSTHGAVFVVEDNGPGIRGDQLGHVFDRYWQAPKTATLGSGLGLAICKGLIEAHGGTIWVESVVGVGSKFFFTVPQVRRVGPENDPPGTSEA
jgi:signal transduction histidine kinase